ncbi:hypothetical protein BCR44DRAFT_1426811, partial [Catenaria anguillulae PL171]
MTMSSSILRSAARLLHSSAPATAQLSATRRAAEAVAAASATRIHQSQWRPLPASRKWPRIRPPRLSCPHQHMARPVCRLLREWNSRPSRVLGLKLLQSLRRPT